jgi:signal transduction histidine kinase
MTTRYEPDNTQTWLETLPPTSSQRWSVIVTAALLFIAFGALAPFASTRIQRFDAFVPLMAAVISITNLITSVLLFAYFSIYRSAALLVLASVYLFTALAVVANALTIPGAFAPPGLLGASLQTAPWLYCIWHTAFPAALVIYAWLKEEKRAQHALNASVGFSIGATVAITFGLISGLTLLTLEESNFLPPLLQDRTSYTALTPYVLTFSLVLCAIALAVLWARRRSILDYWLMIVALSLTSEVAFSLIGGGRASLGAYANRIFALVTSTTILVLLLTEMTRAYAQLARTNAMLQRERNNKLTNLEAMIASISHEIRQPLSAIAMSGGAALRFLGQTSPNLEEVRSNLNLIVGENRRASQVFDNVLALFGRADKGYEPVDVNEIASEVLFTLGRELKDHGIATRTELMSELPLVMGHRGQLHEVLLNLVRNAIEAMDAVKDGSRVLQVRTERHGNDQIVVAVEDSGPGIDQEKLDGIFDAFVSTKPHGIGLGLAICRMIIDRHGGQLSAWSGKKRGAVFQFILPTRKT